MRSIFWASPGSLKLHRNCLERKGNQAMSAVSRGLAALAGPGSTTGPSRCAVSAGEVKDLHSGLSCLENPAPTVLLPPGHGQDGVGAAGDDRQLQGRQSPRTHLALWDRQLPVLPLTPAGANQDLVGLARD